MVILIDIRSTYNIIKLRMAKQMQLNYNPTTPFWVMVGNDDHISCHELCCVVLSLAWLCTLGKVQAYFSIPYFTFTHKDALLTIVGETLTIPTLVTYPQIFHLIHQDFLGLIDFCRCFVLQYATSTIPLTNMLKGTNFTWIEQAQQSFTTLKEKVTTVPILGLPNFSLSFVSKINVSTTTIGATLSGYSP
uniref:Reverse transcriptase/retrotransposon-derived protein RNase H-like domain-containing protein n=1 Tax=Cajanus cajan TaxID=3821 RepID=A0A151SXA9_CAJCA|nr:hypothetical protein KK1_014854 [Cajanus cajan]